MGLFDFALNMGKKLFDRDEDAPTEIKKHIEEDNPGVEDLEVSYESGKVVMKGKAKSTEAFEKSVLIAGNVEGVETVDASGVEAPAAEAGKVAYYQIQSGDTLSGVAKEYLGNGARYTEIFEANKEVIKNPDLIYPGQKIRIPLDS